MCEYASNRFCRQQSQASNHYIHRCVRPGRASRRCRGVGRACSIAVSTGLARKLLLLPKMWLQAISLSLLAVSSHALTTTAAQRPVQALQKFLDDVAGLSTARGTQIQARLAAFLRPGPKDQALMDSVAGPGLGGSLGEC